ncbi:MAG: ABC transporter substrate-binding protein [Rhodoferax sp.]|nr:ABC transporter substrate-binding protein [Rhodoferax sp.]
MLKTLVEATVNQSSLWRSILPARFLTAWALVAASVVALPAYATDEAADAFVSRVSADVIESIQTDASVRGGETSKVIGLVDAKIMPHVNFHRMTAAAVGPSWRQISPDQQKRLQDEFKILLVRTYAGALAQASNLSIVVRPLRSAPDDKDVVVRTEVRGHGAPVQLDYRLEKTAGDGAGWKIYNFNVMGVWLVETYRSQFAQEINSKGVDGLIIALADRNRNNAKKG